MTTTAAAKYSVSAVAAIALFVVIVVSATSMVTATNTASNTEVVSNLPEADPSMRLAALAELGITPEVLAVIDCDATGAQSLVASCAALMDQVWITEYAQLRSSLDTARKAESDALRNVNNGESGVQAVATAKAARASARDALDLHLSALESRLESGLGTEELAEAQRITTRARELGIDQAALAGDFSEAQLVAYRSAVAAERIAAKRGEYMSDEMTAALSLVRNDTAVISARSRVQSRQAALKSALMSIGDEW